MRLSKDLKAMCICLCNCPIILPVKVTFLFNFVFMLIGIMLFQMSCQQENCICLKDKVIDLILLYFVTEGLKREIFIVK